MVDGALVGTEFQSRLLMGKKRMQVRASSGVGDLELVFVPPEALVPGIEQTCSKVYVYKTVHDFVHPADLV